MIFDSSTSKVCLISPGTDPPGEWALLALGSVPGLLRQILARGWRMNGAIRIKAHLFECPALAAAEHVVLVRNVVHFFCIVRPEAEPAIPSPQRAGADARARCGRRARLRVERWRRDIEFGRRTRRQQPQQLRRERGGPRHAAHGIRPVRVAPAAFSKAALLFQNSRMQIFHFYPHYFLSTTSGLVN